MDKEFILVPYRSALERNDPIILVDLNCTKMAISFLFPCLLYHTIQSEIQDKETRK